MSIPVLLVEMPRVQVDIVKGIAVNAGDIDCSESDYRDLDDALRLTRACVIVTAATDSELPAKYDALLYRHPQLRIVSIARDGRPSSLHQLRPHRSLIKDISAADLVATIRAAAEQGAAA